MNVSLTRLNLTALASFVPAAAGAQREQQLGFSGLSADLPAAANVPHLIRLSVTNFGTAGGTIHINADTLEVTLGTAAAATVTDGDGEDYDGVNIELSTVFAVALRVVSAPVSNVRIQLTGPEFKLLATAGFFGLTAVGATGLIAAQGNWTIQGPTGVQTPWVIEILVFAAVYA